MTPDERSLEAELHQLRAVALDESFLSRLDAVAAGTSLELTAQEVRFEESLRRLPAAPLGADFMAELEKIVRSAPFVTQPKIVPFPAAVAAPARRQRPIWGAAAAVALIGAVTALLMPSAKPPASPPRQMAAARPTPPTTATGNFIPASFNRDLSEVHDEGVIWKPN
ncbi:hypothetical protein HQ447_19720, partial [bacterium]|nr:hypothetical protein [bacterium]